MLIKTLVKEIGKDVPCLSAHMYDTRSETSVHSYFNVEECESLENCRY